jgi:hypothetical protein
LHVEEMRELLKEARVLQSIFSPEMNDEEKREVE